jgi:hypothetical protein
MLSSIPVDEEADHGTGKQGMFITSKQSLIPG